MMGDAALSTSEGDCRGHRAFHRNQSRFHVLENSFNSPFTLYLLDIKLHIPTSCSPCLSSEIKDKDLY